MLYNNDNYFINASLKIFFLFLKISKKVEIIDKPKNGFYQNAKVNNICQPLNSDRHKQSFYHLCKTKIIM